MTEKEHQVNLATVAMAPVLTLELSQNICKIRRKFNTKNNFLFKFSSLTLFSTFSMTSFKFTVHYLTFRINPVNEEKFLQYLFLPLKYL